MGTVASSAGVADLLQALSSAGSPLASTFSSPALQSVLQNSSPADIVKLSDQALQLQETDALFGVSDPSAASAASGTGNLLATLDSTLYGSTTPTSSSESAQLAAQSQTQAEQIAALFGVNTDATPSNQLLNVVG